MNCAMPCALSPLLVRGPTASELKRLSCQITRAKNSSGRSCERAADLIIRQMDSRTSVVAEGSFSGAGTSGGCTTFGRVSSAGVSAAPGSPNAPSGEASISASATIEYRASMTSVPVSTAVAFHRIGLQARSRDNQSRRGLPSRIYNAEMGIVSAKAQTEAHAGRNFRRGGSPAELEGNDHRSGR